MSKKKTRRRMFVAFVFTAILIAVVLVTAFAIYFQLEGESGARTGQEAQIRRPEVAYGPTVQIAWFYKPPLDGDLDALSQHFQVFILTQEDEPARDALRNKGVDVPFLRYVRFDAILDPGSCTEEPLHNQVADEPGDYCEISEQHPDWFLLDAQGNRLINQSGYAMMDPGNQEWREYWLRRVIEDQRNLGWDGVFLDNVEASMKKRERLDLVPAAYPTEASYRRAIREFLAYIYQSYFQPQGKPLYANIIELDEDAVWFEYLPYLDGAMLEAFAVDWDDGYFSEARWESQLALAEETQAAGKHILLVAQGEYGNLERQKYAYASYLLATWGNASFRYSKANRYNETWLFDNYAIDLGAPLGPRYQEDGVWKRDFANGQVVVDPAEHTAEIVTTGE